MCNDVFEVNVEEIDRPRVHRALGIPLPLDVKIDSLPNINGYWPSSIGARLCQLYRKIRPQFIGNRCVFEPSCSRYAEYCFRTMWFIPALFYISKRLLTCRSSSGGVDFPFKIDNDKV